VSVCVSSNRSMKLYSLNSVHKIFMSVIGDSS